LGAKLSAILGYLAFDLGSVPLADAYLNEASALADDVGVAQVQAWVRAWESVVAYHRGKYQAALDFARDGQRYAGRGPQAVRLAVAEARALAHIGDSNGATAAIQQALELRSHLPGPDTVGYLLSFEPMGTGRIYAEAAGVHLDLGDTERAERYAEKALDAYGTEACPATRALTLVDLALAHLSGEAADPGAAVARIRDAIAIAPDLPSEVLAVKAQAFVIASRAWAKQPEILDVAAQVEAWSKAIRTPSR
jgi:tetratricopeptide (TPR) repeat protein